MKRWQDSAACRGADTRLFFLDEGPYNSPKPARAICAECPVTAECLEYALQLPGPWLGIYAGLTVKQRLELSRARRKGKQ